MTFAGGEKWSTLESDPGVFTELIESLGVKGVQVEELYALDADLLAQLEPVYGLVFLFKWAGDTLRQGTSQPDADFASRGIFFAKQVVSDACATQALLSILLNAPPQVDIGDELRSFREFTDGFDPELAGLAIGNSDALRRAHNSFSPAQAILNDAPRDEDEGEAFHFVAYLPAAGALYEMDGTQPGPIRRDEIGTGPWLPTAVAELGRRIESFPADEIKFNLLALVGDRRVSLGKAAAEAQAREEAVRDDPDAATACRGALEEAQTQLAAEEAKRALWREENERRRTDYVPAIVALLRGLADEGALEGLWRAEKERASQEAGARV